jgi:hypothetical protein
MSDWKKVKSFRREDRGLKPLLALVFDIQKKIVADIFLIEKVTVLLCPYLRL